MGIRNFGCQGLCRTELKGKPAGANGRGRSFYSEGYVLCMECQTFMKEYRKYYFCLCCGGKVRRKPAHTKKFYEKNLVSIVRY